MTDHDQLPTAELLWLLLPEHPDVNVEDDQVQYGGPLCLATSTLSRESLYGLQAAVVGETWTPQDPAQQALLRAWQALGPSGEMRAGTRYGQTDHHWRGVALQVGKASAWSLGVIVNEVTHSCLGVTRLFLDGELIISVTVFPEGGDADVSYHWHAALLRQLTELHVQVKKALGTVQVGSEHWPLLEEFGNVLLHPRHGRAALHALTPAELRELGTRGWTVTPSEIGPLLSRDGTVLFQGKSVDAPRHVDAWAQAQRAAQV